MQEIKNRKAYHNYEIGSTFVAGVALRGWAVKSIRAGFVDVKDAYIRVYDGGRYALVTNLKITPLKESSEFTRAKRSGADGVNDWGDDTFQLLLTKSELRKLWVKQQEKGVALPLTKIFFKNGRVKVELGVGKGKKNYDKRATEKKKEFRKEIKGMY